MLQRAAREGGQGWRSTFLPAHPPERANQRPSGVTATGSTSAPGRCRLLDRNRVRRRKGILERLVKRLLLASTLVAITFVLMRSAFRIGNHFLPPTGVMPALTVVRLGTQKRSYLFETGPFQMLSSSGCRRFIRERAVHDNF